MVKTPIRIVVIIIAVLATFNSVNAAAQKISPDEAMLARVALKYQSLSSISHTMTGTMKVNSGGVTFTASFKSDTVMARPKRFRSEAQVELLGAVTTGIAMSDGRSLWDVDPTAASYSELPLDRFLKKGRKSADWLMDRAGMDFPLMLFLDAGAGPLFKVKPGAEKSIQVKNFPVKVIDGIPMHVVSMPVPRDKGGKSGTALLYFDAKDLLIRRCRLTMRDKGGKSAPPMSVEFVCFFTNIRTDAEPSPERFTYLPEPETKKLPQVSPAFERAFGQTGD